MTRDGTDETPGDDWFTLLVNAELDALYLHVRMIYPFAHTESTVLEVFGRARSAGNVTSVSPRAWLRRIAREVALQNGDRLAAQRNADAATFGLQDTIDLVEVAELREDLERLVVGLSALSVEEQELLRLSSIDDLRPDELAWIVDLDVQTFNAHLASARDRLRATYSGSVDDEGTSGRR